MLKYICVDDIIKGLDGVKWYHFNAAGNVEEGSKSTYEAIFFAKDIYKLIESMPVMLVPEKVTTGHPDVIHSVVNWVKHLRRKTDEKLK